MYTPTIGLEIHAELKTHSKMFCACKNDPDEKRPNYNICPICAGHPGTLPFANAGAIEKVIKTGLALHCAIARDSKFDRKNYFYPDLPKGYQISQYNQPIAGNGLIKFNVEDAKFKAVRIRRVHLEEDTGRLLHPEGADYSLVDLNRAGIPLMELVTEPDIASGQEARKLAEELQLILRYLGVSSADMEKGLMRVEVNISLKKENPLTRSARSGPAEKLGTKVEIKNLNSFKAVEKAIDFEIHRQTELLESGQAVVQETRGWHDKKEITFSQREKEEAHDYRYFPEPDLPPLHFEKGYITTLESALPELPESRRKRFKKEYGLDTDAIEVLSSNKDLGEYYEKVVSEFKEWAGKGDKKSCKLVANYLMSDVLGLLGQAPFVEKDFKVTPENFAEFVTMIHQGEISSKIAKMVLSDMLNTGADPSSIIEEKGWKQVQDRGELENIIKDVMARHQKAVQDYKSGKQNALQFLAGQVMAATRGTANPEKTRQILEDLLRQS